MLWSHLCRTRLVLSVVIAFLILRMLIATINISLTSSSDTTTESNNNPHVRKGRIYTNRLHKDKLYTYEHENGNSLAEITLTLDDIGAIRGVNVPEKQADTNTPILPPNGDHRKLTRQFGEDARRAQISKDDLVMESTSLKCLDIKNFTVKHSAVQSEDKNHSKSLRFRSTSFQQSLQNNGPNCADDLTMVITVFSSPHNFEIRCAIRETWGSVVHKPRMRTRLFFVLAQPKPHILSDELTRILEKENDQYKDVLRFDFIDSHENLTLKAIHTLRWVEAHCRRVKYVLKTDEDVFINVPHALQELRNTGRTRFIMGSLIEKGRPLRDRRMRYYTPRELYPAETYPNYMSGTAYVISGDVLHDINVAVRRTKFFWLEDVYITGMCAKRTSVTLINSQKFSNSDSLLNPCFLRFLISRHGMTPDRLRHAWQILYRSGIDCSNTETSRVLN